MHINCLTVLLWLRTVSSSGVFTHTEVAHRALLNYDSDQFGAGTVRSILLRRQAAFQAGAAFPDSFYNPLCGEQGRNSIALLKSQQTFKQSFYSSVEHPVVLETLLKRLLKSLLIFQQSY